MKNGMFVICGNSIEELEADLKGMKAALGMGKRMACGGSTPDKVEQALAAIKTAFAESQPSTLAQSMINAIKASYEEQKGGCVCDNCCGRSCHDDLDYEEEEGEEVDLDEILEGEEYEEYIRNKLEDLEEDIYDICTDSDLCDKEKHENIVELLNERLIP